MAAETTDMTDRNLLECVPNFSEGRDRETIDVLARAFTNTPGVRILNIHSDPYHNRSVFTTVGQAPALLEGVFTAISVAVGRLDLRKHRGEHPRVGIADVIPFISLNGTAPQTAIEAAHLLGARLARELQLPVYLYGDAAKITARTMLPPVRRAASAWVAGMPGSEKTQPDLGPAQPHASGGACIVGARDFLVAFNVLLDTPDIDMARTIARSVRTANGGPPGIRALAFAVAGRAQVSMNLFDLSQTTVKEAFELVKRHALDLETAVLSSEIVGLVPEHAVSDLTASDDLMLGVPIETLILERKLEG